MKQFEYKIVALTKVYDSELNDLGAEGWELVSVTGNPAVAAHYIFKREILK